MTGVPTTVKAQCSACNATGIYRGMAEPPGVGVVCLNCNGTGATTVSYVPFTQRNTRTDVQVVHRSRGTMIFAGVGPTGVPVSYQDFLKGKLPQ